MIDSKIKKNLGFGCMRLPHKEHFYEIDEVEAAKVRFYNITEKIENQEKEAAGEVIEEPKNEAYLDFSYLLMDLLDLLSDWLFKLFGGAGFGDM